ncbi:hypothetical protein [Bradyrhizobium barranii]
MPTLTINGRQVSVDDSFLNLPREEQDATVEEIAKSMPAQEPSGAYAGAKHGLAQLAHGIAETAKQNFGIGDGFDKRDPNYVPADPYKPSQWGQLITENIPSMGTAILGGKVAAAMAPGKFKIPAALLGATGAGWLMSSGDTIKDRAANNGHEEPSTSDKVIGNLTSGVGAAASAVPAARLVPGLNRVTGAGASAATSALTKALTTAGSGIAGGAASDLATQVGTTAGTDQGLTVDPSRVGGAAITGGVTSGALATPALGGDLVRAGTLRKYVGDNEAASKNYATRLEAAGNGDLGKAKVDADAHNRVLGDLKTELADAAGKVRQQVQLSPEAENTLSALQKGTKVNPDEIARLDRETAGAPDGANTALLSRTLHVADMVGDRGSRTDKGWAGGLSGKLDKSVDFYLNPLRVAGGIGATAAGLHVFGLFNPKLVGSIAAGYGASRLVDGLTGMRSPAKTFAEHFADRNAQLRVPTAQQPPAAAPPAPGPQGPLVPSPPQPPAMPQAAPQAAPAGPDPLVAATMARISLLQKQRAQPQPEPVSQPAPAAPEATPAPGGIAQEALVRALLTKAAAQSQQAPQAERITKASGEEPKVKAAAAQAKAAQGADVPYEPLSEEYLYPKGISPKEYAMREAAKNNVRSEKYIAKAEASERRRQGIAREIKAKHPDAARAIDWVVRELQRVGTNPKEIARTVRYAQENVADDVAKALEAFK